MLSLVLAAALQVQQVDQQQYLSIGFASTPQVSLLLQDRQGICPAGWKMALLIGRSQPVFWLGCWKAENDKVSATFEDGDKLELPLEAVNWRTGKRPATM